MCRRSPPACDRWHIRQPVPAATFTAVLPRGSGGDTGGARRNRQGMGIQRKDRCSGGRRPSGVVAGNRGGSGLAAGGAGQGRGRPPPRPVGISAQARSVTAGAGLAFRGRLAGAPGPLRAAGIADLGTARRVNPEPKDPKGGLTRLDGPGTSRLATARPGVDGCQVPAAGGAVRLRATVSTDAGTRVRMMWTPSAGRGQLGRPRRWGAGPRRPVDAGPGPHGDRLPAVSSPPLTCKAPSATRSVPARAASSEGCEAQNSRMAEAMASSRARSSSVTRAALLWPERVTPVRRRGRVEEVDGGPRPSPMARTHPPGGATGGRHRGAATSVGSPVPAPFDLAWPYGSA